VLGEVPRVEGLSIFPAYYKVIVLIFLPKSEPVLSLGFFVLL